MKLSGQFKFFLRNDFEHKKASKCKTNDFLPLRSFCVCQKLLPLLFFDWGHSKSMFAQDY